MVEFAQVDFAGAEAMRLTAKKEKQRKLPSAALRLVPSPRYFANFSKRSRTTPFSRARTMPTRFRSAGKLRMRESVDKNQELTPRPLVVLHTFVMRRNVASDNFRLPICVVV